MTYCVFVQELYSFLKLYYENKPKTEFTTDKKQDTDTVIAESLYQLIHIKHSVFSN